MKERIHDCECNPYEDAEIRYQKINQVDWAWVLCQWQLATDRDVEGGFESEVGSAMCSHNLVISHCPFCGQALSGRNEAT